MKKLLYITFLLGLAFMQAPTAFGQTTDEQLAAHYFREGDFEKAALYYEKLYGKTSADTYYDYYLTCLIELKDVKTAEKVIKRQMKRNPSDLTYYVDLGQVYLKNDDEAKARQQYDKAIKGLGRNQAQITNLANAFIEKNELDQALACYQKGRKIMGGNYNFNFEIATVQGMKGDHAAMINEYLDLLARDDRYIQSVQNALNRTLDFEEKNTRTDLLRTELLKRVQRNPNKVIFADMLVWLFIQQKDFNAAFVQAKGLDKRNREMGERVMTLGDLCTSNREYRVAIKCYKYVSDLGPDGFYYSQSKIQLLDVMNQKITNSDYTQEELETLEANYLSTLSDLGRNGNTILMIKDMAHLQAFYLNKKPEAIDALEEALNLPGLSKSSRAKVKLELGDIMVLNGDIWDASLYYSQVDKSFKHDVLGHEAKFRNARISFYTGDFEWSQAQLDILKASTSKLISNDAMDLSLLITDNLNLDTSTTAMLMYSRADLFRFQNQFDAANAVMDSILEEFPGHALTDEIYFQKYKIERRRQNFEGAISYLLKIITGHGEDIIADDATFLLAELYQYQLKELEKAQEYYEKLLLKYPGSLYVVEARKRFRELRGETFNSGEIRKIEK